MTSVAHVPSLRSGISRFLLAMIALLAPAVLLVHGYHPLADDGAVYVTGIQKLANASLYRSDAVFAVAPTRFSIFAHVLAPLLPWISLPVLLLVCHVASIFLFLLGVWMVATRLFSDRRSCWGAVLLAACCFTLPVAGTSLSIMDPYVTARSFSTPLSLFVVAAVLDEKWLESILWVSLAALFHPLMAGYTAMSMLTLALAQRKMWRFLGLMFALGWLLAAVIFIATHPADASLAYNRAALSRSYFFLSRWRWYEYPGLVIPLVLLGVAGARSRLPWRGRALAMSAALAGCWALTTSLCFVHRDGSLLLARMQLLRAFHLVYLAGVVLAGGVLGRYTRRHIPAMALFCLLVSGALFAGQRLTYPESNHVEWPGTKPRNQWREAFVWIRDHTPTNAVIALDNDYIESAGEDAQGFRATAERSAVADWFKDGGIAGNFSQAAALWWQGSTATERLNQASDAQRLARLQPLGVTWMVLPLQATTGFPCPFTNGRVRVCRLSGALLQGAEGAK